MAAKMADASPSRKDGSERWQQRWRVKSMAAYLTRAAVICGLTSHHRQDVGLFWTSTKLPFVVAHEVCSSGTHRSCEFTSSDDHVSDPSHHFPLAHSCRVRLCWAQKFADYYTHFSNFIPFSEFRTQFLSTTAYTLRFSATLPFFLLPKCAQPQLPKTAAGNAVAEAVPLSCGIRYQGGPSQDRPPFVPRARGRTVQRPRYHSTPRRGRIRRKTEKYSADLLHRV